MIDRAEATLSTEQVARVLHTLRGADGVEISLGVAGGDLRSAVAALAADPWRARVRQVAFFDRPDRALDRRRLTLRVRRIHGLGADVTVELRPRSPGEPPDGLRRSTGFTVVLHAMAGGFEWSASMAARVDDRAVREMIADRRSIRDLLSPHQRELVVEHAPEHADLDGVVLLRRLDVTVVAFALADLPHRVVAEAWPRPHGRRALVVTTRCDAADTFDVAAETRAVLARHGIDAGAVGPGATRPVATYFAPDLAIIPRGAR